MSTTKQLVAGQFLEVLKQQLVENPNAKTQDLLKSSVEHYRQSLEGFDAPCGFDLQLLANLKQELNESQKLFKEIDDKATRKAKNRLRFAFLTCFGQLTGMGVGIYGVSSWDVVEPLTFLLSAFWLMTGSAFWLRHKIDFSYSSSFEYFKAQEL